MAEFYGTEIQIPQTAAGDSDDFTVGNNSVTIYIYPSVLAVITEADSFSLHRKLSDGRYLQVFDSSGAVLLGAARTEYTVVDRGVFRLTKIITTELMGAKRLGSFERVQ